MATFAAALRGICPLFQPSTAPDQLSSTSGHTFAVATYAKRPQNAYMHFANDQRSKYAKDGLSLGEVAKALGEAWRSMSAKQKTKYETLAVKDKKRYEKDIASGMAEKPRRTSSSEGKKAKAKKEGPKRARSAYIFFTMEQRSKYATGDRSVTEVSKILGAEWKKLKAASKKKYETMAVKDKTRYQEEVEAMSAVVE